MHANTRPAASTRTIFFSSAPTALPDLRGTDRRRHASSQVTIKSQRSKQWLHKKLAHCLQRVLSAMATIQENDWVVFDVNADKRSIQLVKRNG
jgi:folate-binding Fe-S cluster repair protein YgfZ